MAFKDSRSSKTKSSSKNNKKGNLFQCFRPVVIDPDYGSGRGDRVLTYIEEGGGRRFSSALKAVNLFEVSMDKKTKKGKSNHKKPKNLMSESARFNYQVSSNEDRDFDFGQRIISRSASDLVTSSSSSSSSLAVANSTLCPSCSSSFESKSTQMRGYDSSDCGLVLLLLSLLTLVFWGKICAIFCTSTWLFLMPRWMPAKKLTWTETNSSEGCTKRIVRERLLGRDRGSFRCV